MEDAYQFFGGVDWASETHQACVLDAAGQVVGERSVQHSGTGVTQFLDWLQQLSGGEVQRVAVSIEMPHGAVVESLMERGFHVFAINPKQLDRFRDRYSPAGAKDDRRDAFVLADSLRTDLHCFRRVEVDDPLVVQLRELSRAHEELKEEAIRLGNRLWAQLQRFYPQILQLSPAADEPWIWRLLELAPTPQAAQRLRAKRVERLLREHRIRRVSATQVLETLRQPALYVAPGTSEAATEHIALLIPRLRLVHDQRHVVQRRVEQLLEQLGAPETDQAGDLSDERREHRDAEIILSVPGIGTVVAGTMLAEASWALRERDYHSLRVLSGVAPVTKRSGKRLHVDMRRACNARLRNAVYFWANAAVQRDPYVKAAYSAMRAQGHSHGRALRGVADRQLKMLVAMLRDGTLYDPNRRPQPVAAAA
jgi:transposase